MFITFDIVLFTNSWRPTPVESVYLHFQPIRCILSSHVWLLARYRLDHNGDFYLVSVIVFTFWLS